MRKPGKFSMIWIHPPICNSRIEKGHRRVHSRYILMFNLFASVELFISVWGQNSQRLHLPRLGVFHETLFLLTKQMFQSSLCLSELHYKVLFNNLIIVKKGWSHLAFSLHLPGEPSPNLQNILASFSFRGREPTIVLNII